MSKYTRVYHPTLNSWQDVPAASVHAPRRLLAHRRIAGAVAVALAVIVAVATSAIEGVPLEWSAWTGRFLVALGVIVSMAQGFYRAFKDAVDAVEGGVSLPRRAMPGGGA